VVHPYWRSAMAAQDTVYGATLGSPANGNRRAVIGEPSSWTMKYSGDCGPLQNFARGRFVGASQNLRYPPATVLPGTKAPLGGLPNLPVVPFLGPSVAP
jgi:hypothetical protein